MEKLKCSIRGYFSNTSKTIFIVVLILMGITVYINSSRKVFTVCQDGEQNQIVTFKNTYGKALNSEGINLKLKDKTSEPLDSKISNGAIFTVKRAVNVEVNVGGETIELKSAEDNVYKMLNAEGIEVRENDSVSPSSDTPIKEGLKVSVTRNDVKLVRQFEKIDFATVVKNDNNMEKGTDKIMQQGALGEKEILIRVLYENGKEVAKSIISETIKKAPVDKVIAMGTMGVFYPSRGNKILFDKQFKMSATAYSSGYSSTGKYPNDLGYGITATGTVAKRNKNGYSSVAVDPRVITLGTKLYIPGYGYAIAEDVGGGIKGNKIDLYFDTDGESYQWGVRWVDVYVLK